MKCMTCGGEMKSSRENYKYDESGLDLTLANIEVRRCANCGETEAVIPQMEALHRAVAHSIVRKQEALMPQEIKFLRKYLGFSGADYARAAGVTPESVSRWENGGRQMDGQSERVLRLMVLLRSPIQAYQPEELSEVAVKPAAASHLRAQLKKQDWQMEPLAAAP